MVNVYYYLFDFSEDFDEKVIKKFINAYEIGATPNPCIECNRYLKFEKLFEKECYAVLEKIKAILEDDRLGDKECFEKIERIGCLFEEIGSDCGGRHDFG